MQSSLLSGLFQCVLSYYQSCKLNIVLENVLVIYRTSRPKDIYHFYYLTPFGKDLCYRTGSECEAILV